MLQVKNILCDLVDYAYKDNPKLENYKRFYIEVSEQNRNTFHGDYNERTHHIRIFNMYRDDAAIIATTIHELAHHIDTCNRGRSDHSKEFYTIFEHLLKTALNMGLFNKEQFFASTRDASDSNKIRKMIENFDTVSVGYKDNVSVIRVKNCFDIKDDLKSRGYHYNSIEKSWELETSEITLEEEFLKSVKVDIEYDINNNYISFQKKTYICAVNGSFDIKDELKEDGFFFDKNKKIWKKEGSKNDLDTYSAKYPDVQWRLL